MLRSGGISVIGKDMWNPAAVVSCVFLGVAALHAEEDDWEKQVKARAAAAEADFATWKATGALPEEFRGHAIWGERPDLILRQLAGDRLAETELKTDLPAKDCEVTIRATVPSETEFKGDFFSTEWRRITRDRFEIWTPERGWLYNGTGRQVAATKVRRADGWGREWYGAFLPDGRWVTTDIHKLDRELTAFSAKGRELWAVKGEKLIPEKNDRSETPLIAWARSDREGKAWIVSVGSEWGRGIVKVGPDGRWSKIDDPWKACFPQQLGARGMYTDLFARSDDGALVVNRTEAGHGPYVGWPEYHFPGRTVTIPESCSFGILPDSWAVFATSGCVGSDPAAKRCEGTGVWFFDAKGQYQSWTKGLDVGASLATGGLWLRQTDGSCVRVEKGYSVNTRLKFVTRERKPLVAVEIHDDIRLGMFRMGDEMVLGTWDAQELARPR